MTHALTTNVRLSYLNTAALTNDVLVTGALVLSTGTFPVLGRAEDALTEQAVLLRLESTVVDGFWLLYFTSRPRKDVCRGG